METKTEPTVNGHTSSSPSPSPSPLPNSDRNGVLNHEQDTEVMEIDLRQGKLLSKIKMNGNHTNGVVEEENGDEPDAMTTSQHSQPDLHKLKDFSERNKKKLHNGKTCNDSADNVSEGEEDMEEDNRLIIDDVYGNGSGATSGASASAPTGIMKATGHQMFQDKFVCPQCDLVTSSAKAYLYHLDTVHKVRTSSISSSASTSISPLTEGCEASTSGNTKSIESSSSKREFLNLSVPITDRSSSAMADDTDDGEDEPSTSHLNMSALSSSSMPMNITTDNIDKILDDDKKKKKKTRQEVDPGKYFEAVDSSGTKYACSQCGNIYKWRKSLNKHWKEKHLHDPLAEVASPPGMLELLKSGKYTQLGARRIYDKNFLSTIKTQKDDSGAAASSHRTTPNSVPDSPSPSSFLNTSQILSSNVATARLVASMTASIPSKMIGPFVANGPQPVFPGMGLALPHLPSLQNGVSVGFEPSKEEGALDLTRVKSENSYSPFQSMAGSTEMNSSFDQDQPLDFSKKKERAAPVKEEKAVEDSNNSKNSQGNQATPKIHRCSKCDFSSMSETEFAAHTASHYNKRIVKCFECKLQLNSMEELNSHFSRDHNKKLTEYKEAIKKIPHGLQQTYHLLKMDLQSIGELNNQDLGASESKSLKCKKCDFEAKWPAELQKHAVSHSEERPYICMVCGSTYKWKWDLVKHFQKSHPILPNPYRRNDKRETPDGSSEEDAEEEPEMKKVKLSAGGEAGSSNAGNPDDGISVEGILAATQAGQRMVSSQPNLLDNDPMLEQNLALMRNLQMMGAGASPMNMSQEIALQIQAQRILQESLRERENASANGKRPDLSTSPHLSASADKDDKLPYKCTMCNYHARWPSEITQHMKNHSDSKPYLCPRCDYRSKWKWDVVKHLKRCGGGTINDVIDTTKKDSKESPSRGPPNVLVGQYGNMQKMTPQPFNFVQSVDANGQPTAVVFHPSSSINTASSSSFLHQHEMDPCDETASNHAQSDRNQSGSDPEMIDLTISNNNNNDDDRVDNNVNNNYAAYTSGQPLMASTPISASSMMAASSANESMSNLSRNTSPAPPSTPITTNSSSGTSRQNASADWWHCPHCSFSTQSQAELKRHSGLHKEDKPFKCDECHYSTRWACDLKKHRKSYEHYPKRENPFVNNHKDVSKIISEEDSLKCDNNEKSQRLGQNQARFKCYQCSIYFGSLQELMDHRKATHTDSKQIDQSYAPETVKSHEIDAARIKHPRKQIKQLTCPKCPFVCKNRLTMDQHMEEHEKREKNALHCFYCSLQFIDKESLLDHIVSHPAFNPKEWETFFMVNEEDEQIQEQPELQKDVDMEMDKAEGKEKPNPTKANTATSSNSNTDKKHSEDAATQARIQQILDEIPKQNNAMNQPSLFSQAPSSQPSATGFNKFKCEWCPAEFINLTAVYKHASQAHPIQLKEQDNNMTQAFANLHNLNQQRSQDKSPKVVDTADALQQLKQQIAEKRNQQLAEKLCHMSSSNPKIQEVLTKRLEEEKLGSKKYQCDKCTFSTPSAQTFQRHMEFHGSKSSSQCWFCDYSVARMDVLYQHMKISHTRKWKALSQDPKYASQIQRMNLAFGNSSSYGNNNDSPPGPSLTSPVPNETIAAMDLSSKRSTTDMSHDIMYVTRQQYTWSGIPVNVVPGDNTLNFVCPICSFTDANIGNTCNHVMQSHSAMSKFRCKQCNFSDDNIHIMSDHCKTCHPVNERIVEVLEFKQLNFTDFQMVQLNAMKEKMPQMATNVASTNMKKMVSPVRGNSNVAAPNYLSCPFCPYKSPTKANLKEHILNHNSDSRFRCEQCDFSANLPAVISDHVKVHSANYLAEEKPNIKVKQEESDSDRTANITNITQKEMDKSDLTKSTSPKSKTSGRIRYRCSVCPYHTTCKSNIFKHKRQHVNPKRYKCPKCSYTAARAVLLRNHLESHSVPVEDDSYYHDIFLDPHDVSNDKIVDEEDVEQDTDMTEGDDESSTSDDLENEMDTKAIADLEARDIMEAEAAFKASAKATDESVNNENTLDKQLRKQKCAHCPFSSNSVYEFKKHLNFHGTQERYKCDHCNYSIDRINLLSQHRKLHTDEANFNHNPSASTLLNTSFILLQHHQNEMSVSSNQEKSDDERTNVKATHQLQEFACSFCPYKVSCEKSLDIHTSSHGQRRRFLCDYCDWSTDRFSQLNHHRKVHENELSFDATCENQNLFLNKEFDDGTTGEFEAKFQSMDHEDKSGHGEGAKSPPFKLTVVKKSYPCKVCPFKTKSKNSFQFHISMHGCESPFQCSECDFAAPNQGFLRQHSLLHHSLPTSLNDEKDSSSLIKLENDLKSKQELSAVSQDDPFVTLFPNTLREHKKCHAPTENLQCPYCDVVANSSEIMYRHIQNHFPGTKLEPSAMDRMLEEHAGKNNNNNNIISKNNNSSSISTKTESSLDLTKNTQDGKEKEPSHIVKTKIYVCQYCEREFEAKSLMIQHEKQHLLGMQS